MLLEESKFYLHRLLAMSPGEMVSRLRRHLFARWSRFRKVPSMPSLQELLTDSGVDPESLWAAERERLPLPSTRQLPRELPGWFASRWPDARRALLRAADDAAARRFTIFSSALSFNGRIDWHYDPILQRSMPLDHWTAIPYWRPNYCPGVKHIWELNRHQHFVTLAQAWRLSQDERYLQALLEQWQGWLDDNPPGRGINWTSMLELGLRLISWSWALQLVKSASLFTPEMYRRILVSVHQQAEQIRANLSSGSSANNHLLGECLGLIYAGACFPDLKKAPEWRSKGFGLFWSECERQVYADGVIKEQSTGYARYLFDYGILAILAAEAAGHTVPPVVLARMERIAEFISPLIDASGNLPPIGDGDDGQALLLDPAYLLVREDTESTRTVPGREQEQEQEQEQEPFHAPSPWRDLLGTAGLRFGRDEFKVLSAGFSPALFWLFGAEVEKAFAAPGLSERTGDGVCHFPEGGYAILRSSWKGMQQIALFDAGPLGLDKMAAHGHADALNFVLTAGSEPVLVDSGTYLYRGTTAWRNYFRGTSAHNTVRIDGREQSQIVGPFQWGRRAHATLEIPVVEGEKILVAGEHDGYAGMGVTHRRSVTLLQNVWLVEDWLIGRGRHEVELFWHLAPCRYVRPAPGLLEADFRECALCIRLSGPPSMQIQVCEGSLEPMQGWISPRYAVKKSNPVLCINTNEPLPVHIKTEIRIEPR